MKNIKRIAAALLVMAMALVLTACGKPDLEGKWIAAGGSLIDGLLEEMQIGSLEDIGMELSYDFKKDGVVYSTVAVLGESEVTEGKWEVDGDTLTITFEDGPNDFTFELDGDKLTIKSGEYDIIFKKAN